MEGDLLSKRIKTVMAEIAQKKQSLENIKKQINNVISNLFIPVFQQTGSLMNSDYSLFFTIEEKWNEAKISLFNNDPGNTTTQNYIFYYQVKIENFNLVIVSSSGTDPDINSFKPRDIFGDFEPLQISNITDKQVIDDFLEKYKISEIKGMEESFLA